MFLQNLKSVALSVPGIIGRNKSVALSVPGIIGRTQKNLAAPGYAHAPFSPKFLWAFIRIGPGNVLAKFEVRSFTRSRDNSGYPKMDSPWIRPRSIFSKIFNGLLFGLAI